MPAAHTAGAAGPGGPHLRVVDDATAQAAEDAAVESAREQVLAMLTSRPRTRAELATALGRKGVDPGVADEVLDRMSAVGLVDDGAYARAYAEREAGRKGPRAVVDALQRRGIDPTLAREVAFQGDPHDVRAAALEVARTALPRMRGLERPVIERRLAGLLARRGYGSGVVYGVVRELLGDSGEDLEPLD
jgi:regulatory protein